LYILKPKLLRKFEQIKRMGFYQRKSPKRAQDIADRGHPTQIQGFPINPGFIFPPAF
jgi:hypothetical protein